MNGPPATAGTATGEVPSQDLRAAPGDVASVGSPVRAVAADRPGAGQADPGALAATSDFARSGPGTAWSGRRQRAAWLAACTVAAIAGFECYLRMSQTVPVNSDGAANALQAWAMLHGNGLLHGWWLSDVSFYTTELPQYMLVEAIRGLGPDVVHVAAAMTYALLVLLAALLAKGRATGRAAVARAGLTAGIMVAPQLGHATYILLLSPDHVGTLVPLLLLWIVIDRGRDRWYVPVAAAVLLAWVQLADPLVLIIGVLPLLIACAARCGRKLIRPGGASWRARLGCCRPELSLAAAAAAAMPAASLAGRLITASGGFQVAPANTIFSTARLLPDARLAWQGVLAFFGAYIGRQTHGPQVFFAAVHLLGLALAALALGMAWRRFWSWEDILIPAFAAAIPINIAAYIASTTPQNIVSSREFAAVLPFAAVLAGRVLTGKSLPGPGPVARAAIPAATRAATWRAVRPLLRLTASAGLLCYAAALGFAVAQPPLPAENSDLAGWLARHHLRTGLGAYWQADSVQLDSAGSIVLSPVTGYAGKVIPVWYWEADRSWFDSRSHYANFIVTARPISFEQSSLAPQAAVRTFGQPAFIYHFGRYTILVFHKNLLSELQPAR